MKRFLMWSVPVLACCVATVAVLLVKQELEIRRRNAAQRVADWRSYAERGHRIGPASAPVTVVVFSDYQCPFTRRLAQDLVQIREEMPSLVSVVHRHYPLKSHAQAFRAAAAAECATREGLFRELHDLLTTSAGEVLEKGAWLELAAAVGIQDKAAFEQCMASPEIAAMIDTDVVAGRRLGVLATPTILVNDRKYAGLPRNLNAIIRTAAEKVARND